MSLIDDDESCCELSKGTPEIMVRLFSSADPTPTLRDDEPPVSGLIQEAGKKIMHTLTEETTRVSCT
jgi:hypothetical protein